MTDRETAIFNAIEKMCIKSIHILVEQKNIDDADVGTYWTYIFELLDTE